MRVRAEAAAIIEAAAAAPCGAKAPLLSRCHLRAAVQRLPARSIETDIGESCARIIIDER
eukprot:2344032-Pleurochrysis_carterae.AAC.2